jgi:TRAP-type C4-dicarboxylate transport system substrate-binding protein
VPADLKGLKIRTMDSQMAIDMMTALGGSATVMGMNDTYAGLQSGIVDGAENNPTVLLFHAEVTKFYSFDEHTRIPDIVLISSALWDQMSDNQRAIIKDCAKAATDNYKTAWVDFENEMLNSSVDKYGITLVRDVDMPAFQAAVKPIYDNLKASDPEVYGVVESIRAVAPAPAE